MSAEPFPIVAPLEAIAFFRRKGFTFGFSWQDVWQEVHATAFTVAKAMRRDILEDIREAVDAAIAEGKTLDQFRRELQPVLEEKGWWGKKRMIDPETGENKLVQLGSPRRLKTIYSVNMRTAYAAGRWERIDREKKAFPILVYRSVKDGRERPEHGAWHDTALPVDDPWWDTHYPPCDWECRCTAVSMNARMLAKKGLELSDKPISFPTRQWVNKRTGEIHHVEEGIGPGWSYNVGKAALAGQAPVPLPGAFNGEDIADARSAAAPIAAFFDAVGIAAGDARRGRVILDAAGWELPISLAWFQLDGRLMLPAPRRRGRLGDVGRALVQPDEIRLVWVRGANGRAMLMRRYVTLGADGAAELVVDIGREGWRWRSREDDRQLDRLRRGVVAWSRQQAAIAGYNPYQPRNPKGSPGGGRFKSTGLDAFLASLDAPAPSGPGLMRLGNASPGAIASIEQATKTKLRSPAVWLEHGFARHALLRHGNDDRPITLRDLRGAHLLLNKAGKFDPGHGGRVMVEVGTKTRRTVAIFELRRRGLVLVSMHKRQPRRKGSRKVSPA